MSAPNKTALKNYKKMLTERLADLEHVQARAAEAREPVTLDQTTQGRLSRMDALQVQAMALETDRRRELEIKRITATMVRMEQGEFGYCISCGYPVESRRLDNDPSTPTCIGCAQNAQV